jgi:hypothetical protein
VLLSDAGADIDYYNVNFIAVAAGDHIVFFLSIFRDEMAPAHSSVSPWASIEWYYLS